MHYSASGAAQALRMLRQSDPTNPIVVVEGATDVKALRPFVKSEVRIQSVGRKSLVLGAREILESAKDRGFIFVVDCDNEENVVAKAAEDVFISSNRDLECDLLFHLGAAVRISHELLPSELESEEVSAAAKTVLDWSVTITCQLNTVKDEARRDGARLRLKDPVTGLPRRISFEDMPPLTNWSTNCAPVSIRELIGCMAPILHWDRSCAEGIAVASEDTWNRACLRHVVPNCASCRTMQLCNGHDLEDALAAAFSAVGSPVSVSELARMVRVAADANLLNNWPLVHRLRRYEERIGASILRSAATSGPT